MLYIKEINLLKVYNGTLLSANYHYNGKSVCIFQIKAFYLKKLHFNCTFSLDPVSIIYNYKQGFEEMIW
jgi:hypothetical protein